MLLQEQILQEMKTTFSYSRVVNDDRTLLRFLRGYDSVEESFEMLANYIVQSLSLPPKYYLQADLLLRIGATIIVQNRSKGTNL